MLWVFTPLFSWEAWKFHIPHMQGQKTVGGQVVIHRFECDDQWV